MALSISTLGTTGSNFSATADASTLSVKSFTFDDTDRNVMPGLGVMNEDGVRYPVVSEPGSFESTGSVQCPAS